MKISQKLFEAALKAMENSYSPYSNFKVGAALLSDNGKIYSGCNVENVSYPCGACAETGAISNMVTEGGHQIAELLVIADSKDLITPCGACRQRIIEFSDKNTIVHMADIHGIKKTITIKELLPLAFDSEELHNACEK